MKKSSKPDQCPDSMVYVSANGTGNMVPSRCELERGHKGAHQARTMNWTGIYTYAGPVVQPTDPWWHGNNTTYGGAA